MPVPPSETTHRFPLRAFVLSNLVILVIGALIVWGTGMIGSDIDWQGWIAIILALIATSLLGSGLMALAFYSSSTNQDEIVYDLSDENEPR